MRTVKASKKQKEMKGLLSISGMQKFEKQPISHTTSLLDDNNHISLPSIK